jgi:hypothetical protein
VKDHLSSLEGKNQQPAAWSPATPTLHSPPATCAWTTPPSRRRTWPAHLPQRRRAVTSARRQPRRLHRMGPGEVRGPGRSGAVPGVERCARDRWRRGVLARWTAGSRRLTRRRRGTLEVQGGIGRDREPDQLPRPTASSTSRLRRLRWRLVPPVGRRPVGRSRRRAPPASFMPDIARQTSQGGIVWVFGLP